MLWSVWQDLQFPLTRFAALSCAALCTPLLLSAGCGETAEPPVNQHGSIRVLAQTSAEAAGAQLDPDGYMVAVEGLSQRSIEPNGSVTFTDLSVGDHIVTIEGLQINCTTPLEHVLGTVSAGSTVDVTFAVTCRLPTTERIVFSTDLRGPTDLYTVNPDGTDLKRITTAEGSAGWPTGGDVFAAWSPDGWRIAFMRVALDLNYDIYVANADGTGLRRVTTHVARDMYPAWSPDNSQIAFASDRDGDLEIYLINVDGTDLTQLTNNSSDDLSPAWLPDGSKLAFTSERDGNLEVYAMNADGTGQVNLTNHSEGDWMYGQGCSPDGARIAFGSSRDGNWELYVMNADGTNPVNLTNSPNDDEHWSAWSPDGSKILYYSSKTGRVHYMNADGTGGVNVTGGIGGAEDKWPDWSHGTGFIP